MKSKPPLDVKRGVGEWMILHWGQLLYATDFYLEK